MAPTVTCNAALKLPAFVKKPATPTPAGAPLTPQFHWARPHTAALASSSALDFADVGDSKRPTFVRPDLVDAADEVLVGFMQATRRPSSQTGKPHFRSALEQVSFDTNNSLLETSHARPRGSEQQRGLLSRAAKLLGK